MKLVNFSYKIPGDPKSEGKDYTWYAVLVWVGRKPSPKFNATKDKLASAQYFQNQPVTYDQLADLISSPDSYRLGVAAPAHLREEQPLDDCMRVGEVSGLFPLSFFPDNVLGNFGLVG